MGFVLLNQLPTGCKVKYDPLVYNSKTFLSSNNDLPQLHFYWVERAENVAFAHIAFSLEESEAYSHLKAPFGGVEFCEEISVADLCSFLIFAEKELKSKGVKYLKLSLPPYNYGDNEKLIEVLQDLKYKVKSKKVYHGIQITNEDLSIKLSVMEQRRLKKCVKADFQFKSLPSHKLTEVYRSLAHWRNLVGKPLSMEWASISYSRKLNPDMYHAFGVFDDKKLIAATIAIRVNSKVLYHFYPAHNPDYNNYSPMVMLVNGMYEWCKAHQIELLDLGTSYINNKLNKSLIRFKKHLGGEESKALIIRKVLSSR